jgi:hypothetical protein
MTEDNQEKLVVSYDKAGRYFINALQYFLADPTRVCDASFIGTDTPFESKLILLPRTSFYSPKNKPLVDFIEMLENDWEIVMVKHDVINCGFYILLGKHPGNHERIGYEDEHIS